MIKVLNLWLALAVGLFGKGITWTGERNQQSIGPSSINDVIWTGSEFLAGGTAYLAESIDGQSWEEADLSAFTPASYFRLVLGGGVLALGSNSALFKPSGGAWTQCVMPDGVVMEQAAHDGTRFLGEDGGVIYQSLDGINWNVLAGAENRNLFGLAFGNGKWVGIDGDNIYHSADGLAWASISHDEAFVDPEVMRYFPMITHLEFSGGSFVVSMIEDRECSFNSYGVSTNGIDWSIASAPLYDRISESGDATGVSLGGGGKDVGQSLAINSVSLSENGDPLVIHSSGRGVNNYAAIDWPRLYADLVAVASNPSGVTVAVGDGERGGLIVRADDSEASFWEPVGPSSFLLVDVESDGNTLVAIYHRYRDGRTDDSGVFHTADGVSWAPCRFPDARRLDLQGIRLVNGTWFLVGYDDESIDQLLYTSVNGIDWVSEEFTPITTEYDDFGEIIEIGVLPLPIRGGSGNGWIMGRAEYFSGVGFQAGPESIFARSQNGRDWEELPESLSEMTAGAFGNGQFVAMSQDTVWTSFDGDEWASHAIDSLAGPPSLLRHYRGRWIASYPGQFFPPSAPPTSYISTDLMDWKEISIDSDLINNFQLGDSFEFHGWQISEDFYSEDGLRWNESGIYWSWFPWLIDDFSILRVAPLGDRIVLLADDFQTTRSHPVPVNPTPREFRVVDPGIVEAPVDPAYEYRLNFSSDLGGAPWSPVGDWKSAGGADPFLFWVTDINDPSGFYRMEYRAKE